MTIFAFSIPDGVLHVHRNVLSAVAACPVGEVAAQDWLFFADDGSPLRPDLLDGGVRYYLRPWASCASCSLPQILHLVVAVRGTAPLDTVEGVARCIEAGDGQ